VSSDAEEVLAGGPSDTEVTGNIESTLDNFFNHAADAEGDVAMDTGVEDFLASSANTDPNVPSRTRNLRKRNIDQVYGESDSEGEISVDNPNEEPEPYEIERIIGHRDGKACS
jgi:hypothetical protein